MADPIMRRTLCKPTLEKLEGRQLLAGIVDDYPAALFGSASQESTVEATTSLSSATTAAASTAVGTGYFQTQGNQILDAAGNVVKIAGVNWFGLETKTFAPHGLWARGYQDMMDQMKQLGFNTIRLPFSNQLFDSGSSPNGIDFSKNADLQGLSGLGIMDKIVGYAGQVGLKIILDHHRSSAGDGPEGSGLWYTSAYPEARWISDWKMLATRYAGNSTIIGADLHNEPHSGATWGSGTISTDWRLAAERAGNAVLAVNSKLLIVVEGVQVGPSGWYWWGGNLSAAGAHPVRLNVPGRLVYSPHDYPASVSTQPWFGEANYPDNLRGVWDRNWGYLFRQGIAPILIGELGTKLETTSDQLWLREMVEYLGGDLNGNGSSDLAAGSQGPSWTWWSWNANSGDTGGILKDDWTTVQQAKLTALQPVQFPFGDAPTAPPSESEASSIPGIIQAEDYDQGGEGIAYHDSDAVNHGGAYRSDGVDVKPSSDGVNSYAVGYIASGEWLKYTVNVESAGTYSIDARVASQFSSRQFHIEFNGVDKTGRLTVPMTGPWDTKWATITSPSFYLPAGTQTMRVYMDSGEFDLEHFTISAAAVAPSKYAGNVWASLSGGDLTIVGDGVANAISVESAGAGVVQVRGFGTSVNGLNAIKTFNVPGSINVRMNGGDDLLRVTNLVIRDNLTIELGGGRNEVLLGQSTASDNKRFAGTASGPVYVQDNLKLAGGPASDRVFQSHFHVRGTGSLSLGDGKDTLQIVRPSGSGANVEYGASLRVYLGPGDDRVSMSGLVVDGNMIVNDNSGVAHLWAKSIDVHGDLSIQTANLSDSITVRNLSVDKVFTIATQGGYDSLAISAIADRLVINAGAGNDAVHVSNSRVNVVSAALGAGADQLELLNITANKIYAHGGDGDDLFLVRTTQSTDAYFNGEAGQDTYRDFALQPNTISQLKRSSIERVQRI